MTDFLTDIQARRDRARAKPAATDSAVIERSRSLRSAGRFADGVTCLRDAEATTESESLLIDRELVLARFEAARALIREPELQAQAPRASMLDWPPDSSWPPRVPRAELTAERIADAIAGAGCLWVEGLLDQRAVAPLVEGIDRAFAGYDRWQADQQPGGGELPSTDPWFSAFIPEPAMVHITRPALRAGGGVPTADSPRLVRRWFDLLEESGLLAEVTRLFGETPITSMDKGTLRRVSAGLGIEWHQDGAFLGPENGALNVWLALTDCATAPGLEVVGRRFDDVVETGTGGATYDWSTGPEVIADLARTTPVVNPPLAAGDALIFDGLLLHRTAQDPPDRTRYAIETWFFRPSRFPDHQQVPLAF